MVVAVGALAPGAADDVVSVGDDVAALLHAATSSAATAMRRNRFLFTVSPPRRMS